MQNTPDEWWVCLLCQVKEASFCTELHWGKLHEDRAIGQKIDKLYNEIAFWKKNNFLLCTTSWKSRKWLHR